jgi:hypothetical protein
MSTRNIPVTVTRGLFGSDCAVEIELTDGKKVSLFVDCQSIVRKGEKTFLSLELVRENAQQWDVLLPSEAFETMSRWATVRAAA